jgi:hypothetical protein
MSRFVWVGVVVGVLFVGRAWGQDPPAARAPAAAPDRWDDRPNRPEPGAPAPAMGPLAQEIAAASPPSDAAWQEFRGKVVVSDTLLASQFGSDAVKISSLHRFQRAAVNGAEGVWRLHFIAFLKTPIDGDTVNLIAYESGDKSQQPVRVFEVPVQAGAREVHLNNFVVSESMGFRRGQAYELVIEAPGKTSEAAHGKQDVAARGMITLR